MLLGGLWGCGSRSIPYTPRDCPQPSSSVSQAPGSRSFRQLADARSTPGLADQPSARGRSIAQLFPFNGRVYLAYGDFIDDTGPIEVVAWDPATDSFLRTGSVATEEVLRFASAGGHLFTPAIDPVGRLTEGSLFRLGCGDAPAGDAWSQATPITGAVHVFGLTTSAGSLYVSTGGDTDRPARVLRSDDGGTSWWEELRLQPSPGSFARLTQLAASSGRLFVSGWEHQPYPQTQHAYVREDGTWHTVSGLPDAGSLVPVALADELAIAAFDGDPGKSGRHLGSYLLIGDQLAPAEIFPTGRLINWAHDHTSQPPQLWAMSRDAGAVWIYRAVRFGAWEAVLSLPPLADDSYSAIAVLDNTLYLGSVEGSLFAIEELYAP